MSPYAQNWVDFYGWKNYVPLKGKHLSDEADMLNFDSRRLGGELQEKVHAFEGNQEIPDNPVLQVMADAAIASMRVGRKNITETIYNSAKKSKDNPNGSGLLQTAEVIKIVNFFAYLFKLYSKHRQCSLPNQMMMGYYLKHWLY
jgi:hypothetical protein